MKIVLLNSLFVKNDAYYFQFTFLSNLNQEIGRQMKTMLRVNNLLLVLWLLGSLVVFDILPPKR